MSSEERDFLLRSIRDLDAEWEAGDIDEADYHSLRDEYTARAAAVLRGEPDPIDVERQGEYVHAEGDGAAPRRQRNRLLLGVGGSLVVVAIAAVLIATSVGKRSAGQTITGNSQALTGPAAASAAVRDPRLDRAETLAAKGKILDAVKLYDSVLKQHPDNAEALAYEGWLLRLAGLSDQGLAKELAAEKAAPMYPDAHFFRGVILLEDKGDAAGAVKELQFFLGDSPPPDAISKAEQELQQALKAAGPSVATTVDPRTNPAIASNFGPTTTIAGPTAP